MHELSIAQNVVEIVRQSVAEEELPHVRTVRMKVGAMAGVVPDSLEFCFAALVANTGLSGARLHIQGVPFIIRCNSCGQSFSSEYGFVVCPSCQNVDTDIVSGMELQVEEIELEDKQGVAA